MIVAVMPAYNEENTIVRAVQETKKHVDKVIVVDDFSSDNTAKLARQAGAFVIRHDANHGLGASLRTGFAKALEMKADIIITIDADGQHEPKDITRFVEKINQGYGFVLGERNLSKYPFIKKFGNFFLNSATNFISGTNLKDTESGFRAFTREALQKLYLKAERYEIAVEIVFETGRNSIRAANIPINVPVYVKGVGVTDGVKNFMFLMHRRERNLSSYAEDLRYVLKKWIH